MSLLSSRIAPRSFASAAASSSTPSSFSPLTAIETRWGKLPEAEQGAIADMVKQAEAGDWKLMTMEQKRAAYIIAYGPFGARNPMDPALKYAVTGWVGGFFGLAVVMWTLWEKQKPVVPTMNKEWKDAENQISKENRTNPYSGPTNAVYSKKE